MCRYCQVLEMSRVNLNGRGVNSHRVMVKCISHIECHSLSILPPQCCATGDRKPGFGVPRTMSTIGRYCVESIN